MKITGEHTIPAPQQAVWEALNTPEVLRQSIPGCKSLTQVNGTAYLATVETKIGPMKAVFNGNVEISELDPPRGYTLSGSGSAGSLGGAKGKARVTLAPEGQSTKLSYEVDAEVTGKFAQLGSRLIQGTADLLAGEFFQRFREAVAGPSGPAARRPVLRLSWRVWVPGAIVAAAIIYWLLR